MGGKCTGRRFTPYDAIRMHVRMYAARKTHNVRMNYWVHTVHRGPLKHIYIYTHIKKS